MVLNTNMALHFLKYEKVVKKNLIIVVIKCKKIIQVIIPLMVTLHQVDAIKLVNMRFAFLCWGLIRIKLD